MFSITEASFALRERGINASPATLKRLLRVGVLARPALVGGHHVWTAADLLEVEHRILGYRAGLNRRAA